jgi:hypothetical protein
MNYNNLKPQKLAGLVIGSTGGASVLPLIGLRNFDWIKDYLRDQKARREIETLKAEIETTKALPIDREELKALFLNRIESINKFRTQQMIVHLKEVQNRGEMLTNELSLDSRKYLGAHMQPYYIKFSSKELDEFFDALQDGMPQKEIDGTISKNQNRISELEIIIDRELSPKSRWLFRENGDPHRYPGGCRWHIYAETWKLVASRFVRPVNIEGNELKTENAFAAYHLLGFDNLTKIAPLREPIRY